MQYVLLLLGLGLIVKSADVLIGSSSKIARQYGVSAFVVGVTVVAFGTSAPELAVGILSAAAGANQLTLGNIIGSSLSNTALIVGLSAVIMALQVRDSIVRREIPMLLGVQTVLAVMLLWDGVLSRAEGAVLLLGFTGFILYIVRSAKSSMSITMDAQGGIDTDADGNGLPPEAEEKGKRESSPGSGRESSPGSGRESLPRLWLLSILSLAGLFAGGQLTVDSSTAIAQSFGLSETLIGLTVISLATTLPELITSVVAAVKKEPDIVLGNCIGSNLLNILLVLGLSALIHPIPADPALWIDLAVMLALTALVFLIAWRRKSIRRRTGVLLVAVYVLYLAFKVLSAL